jgi:hypothetical protein
VSSTEKGHGFFVDGSNAAFVNETIKRLMLSENIAKLPIL